MKSTLRLLAAPLALGPVVWAVLALLPAPPPTSDPVTLVARFSGPSLAFARRPVRISDTVLFAPKFDPVLPLGGNGRQIFASGPFSCEAGAKWRVDIEITQGSAVAAGHTQGQCSGQRVGEVGADETTRVILPGVVTVGTWRLLARSPDSFVPGPASGCGKFVVRVGSEVMDSHEWCADFTLEAE